jgi:hypothetical protein
MWFILALKIALEKLVDQIQGRGDKWKDGETGREVQAGRGRRHRGALRRPRLFFASARISTEVYATSRLQGRAL